MRKSGIYLFLLFFAVTLCAAQTVQTVQPLADSKPAATNVPGVEYPRIDTRLRGIFRVNAPNAQKVQLNLTRTYDMVKGEDGYWTLTTEPLDPGFHYYSLIIDGFSFADPASESFFGSGRMQSGIEVPEEGVDFYSIKNVPHGEIVHKIYFSNTTKTWRSINIYTPPNYHKSDKEKFPVLYIQHGGGEDERGWAVQGKTDIILDNLIAEGKAKPMIVVIPNGNVSRPGMAAGGYNEEAMALFKEELQVA